jgi:hypothetical protein
METFVYSEPLPNLDSLLDQAIIQGMVKIKRKDGKNFILQPESNLPSPFDVEGIDVDISVDEIVNIIREGRER